MGVVIVNSLGAHSEQKKVVHVFPCDCNSPKGPPRTPKSCTEYAKRAIEDHAVVRFGCGCVCCFCFFLVLRGAHLHPCSRSAPCIYFSY